MLSKAIRVGGGFDRDRERHCESLNPAQIHFARAEHRDGIDVNELARFRFP
jgi:hypothetical protein